MFESLEVRNVKNGVIVVLTDTEGSASEYVFDTARKALRFIKTIIEGNKAPE
jgi:hypothetical protein